MRNLSPPSRESRSWSGAQSPVSDPRPLITRFCFTGAQNRERHPLQVNLRAAESDFLRRHCQNLDLAFGWPRRLFSACDQPLFYEGFSPWPRLQFLRRLTAHGRHALARFHCLKASNWLDHVVGLVVPIDFVSTFCHARRSHDRAHRQPQSRPGLDIAASAALCPNRSVPAPDAQCWLA